MSNAQQVAEDAIRLTVIRGLRAAGWIMAAEELEGHRAALPFADHPDFDEA